MIKLAASIVVRALVELGLVLLVFGAIFFVVAFRTARRFATPAPDALDRIAGPLSTALGLVASRRRAAASLQSDEPESDVLDELTEEEAEQSVDFWRSVVV